MKKLGFARRCCVVNGRRIRPSLFESRSTLPVSAACLVANTARQTLSELFGAAVSLQLLEPVLPDRAAWSDIGADALVFALRGEHADAAIVLRSEDALALACAALGEVPSGPRELSGVESELAARIAGALSSSLAPICGLRESSMQRTKMLEGYLAYFELIVEQPVAARIGIALSREPVPPIAAGLKVGDLHEIEIRLSVEIAHAFLPAASIVSLRAGQLVKLDSALGDSARALAGGALLARGQCGEFGARRALAVQ